MDHIRQSAYETVLRRCGFTAIGIVFVMTAMSFDPKLAFEAGGLLTILAAFVLILKSEMAPGQEETETPLSSGSNSPEALQRVERQDIARDLPRLCHVDVINLGHFLDAGRDPFAVWRHGGACHRQHRGGTAIYVS